MYFATGSRYGARRTPSITFAYLESAIAWLEKEGKFAKPSDKKATLEAFREGQRLWRKRAEEAAQRRVAGVQGA
jgi:hypothetical protein